MKPVEPAIRRYSDLPESETPTRIAILFICPTPGCGNHYSAQSFLPEDASLDALQYRRNEDGTPVPTRTRRECPDCYMRDGIRVPREPFIVSTVIPYNKMKSALSREKETGNNGDPNSSSAA